MRTILRKVGNSRGIIIPAALLAACEMADEVDIPVHAPRTGWFVGYKPEADVEPLAALPVDDSTEEWAWKRAVRCTGSILNRP
jgi:antitoxin MazE